MRSASDLVSFGSSRLIGNDKEEEEEWTAMVAWEEATDEEKWAVMVGVVCTFVATCFLALIVGLVFGFCCSDKIGACCFKCCPACLKCFIMCRGGTKAQADMMMEMGKRAEAGDLMKPYVSETKGKDDDETA